MPFRLLEDFLSTETDIVEKVPAHYQHFAIALRRAPFFWGDDRAIEEQMALEAHSKARINTILSKVRAQRFLVEKYLSGDLDVGSEAEHEAEGGQEATRGNAPSQRCRLTPSQTKLMEEIQVGVQNAMVAASATSDEEFEDAVLAAQSKRMLFASGPLAQAKPLPCTTRSVLGRPKVPGCYSCCPPVSWPLPCAPSTRTSTSTPFTAACSSTATCPKRLASSPSTTSLFWTRSPC